MRQGRRRRRLRPQPLARQHQSRRHRCQGPRRCVRSRRRNRLRYSLKQSLRQGLRQGCRRRRLRPQPRERQTSGRRYRRQGPRRCLRPSCCHCLRYRLFQRFCQILFRSLRMGRRRRLLRPCLRPSRRHRLRIPWSKASQWRAWGCTRLQILACSSSLLRFVRSHRRQAGPLEQAGRARRPRRCPLPRTRRLGYKYYSPKNFEKL